MLVLNVLSGRVLEDVQSSMVQWNNRSAWQRFLRQDLVKKDIEKHKAKLDGCIIAFGVRGTYSLCVEAMFGSNLTCWTQVAGHLRTERLLTELIKSQKVPDDQFTQYLESNRNNEVKLKEIQEGLQQASFAYTA